MPSADTRKPLKDKGKDYRRAGGVAGSAATGAAVASRARLPTRFGDLEIVVFQDTGDDKEHLALVRPEFQLGEGAPVRECVAVRIHSECATGDVFGSLRCDCGTQLDAALRQLAQGGIDILLYLRQEGRGIGLVNKIRAYTLQDQGCDTVEANLALGFRDDERDYGVAAKMLAVLGVTSVRLMTNNPRKIAGLRAHGVVITGRIPLEVPSNAHNKDYLAIKAIKSGHLLKLRG